VTPFEETKTWHSLLLMKLSKLLILEFLVRCCLDLPHCRNTKRCLL